ncbi:MAG TPA: MmgE/PrpD family protein [Solirubrobacteraceae bacterium]|nr:MmgE/PrpD family protein [Solirubrobacteraceae bacterium]
MGDGYRDALLDWLACAARGAGEPASVAAREAGDGLLERVAAAATAGHVLDFDDTYAPGLAHLSAATAPAAVVLGAELGADVGAVLAAYAAGFEAMGALARSCHPALYDGGWHPTAVCAPAGAAVAAARLLGLDADRTRTAVAIGLLRAGGLRAAFGSDAKALQVGLAAAAGVQAARLAAAGARADADAIAAGPAGFAAAFAAGAVSLDDVLSARGAIDDNWIKAYPCCLQTHAAIDAALAAAAERPSPARLGARLSVAVHPVSRRAAAFDAVSDGLEAKFSIPYLTAYALLHGAPGVDAFAAVDAGAAALAARIVVRTDAALAPDEALLEIDGAVAAHVRAPRGCPANRLSGGELRAKARALAGDALAGLLDDPRRPAADLRAALSPRTSGAARA